MMARLMEVGLERISKVLLDMATLSEKSVSTAIEAYKENKDVTKDIREWSEELRALQDEVSELAIELITKYQPVASDLRFIKSSMEIAYGFSRFGRYAFDIAEVLEMWGDLSHCDHALVDITAKATFEMIRMSIDAYSNKDVELARNIEKLDDFVDDKYKQHVSKMISDKEIDVRCAMSTALILRYLERIADHSSYIGDCVVYILTGEHAPRK
ncbi:MAG: phosphate uptake regulator, PhoU [Thaumarchaeota archaeon]|nr:phosphate uptake regulator, PhoU [Nitrososphaerota archaeon]